MQTQPHTSASTPSYSREDWQRGYLSQTRESAYWVEDIEGEIPHDLQGTLFRIGPGLLNIGEYPVRHPFDGDGMACSIAFKDGRAFFQNRFVRTQGFVEEQKAGKPLYRGVFGTQKPGGWLANLFDTRLKNIANTNIIDWGGKLLALWEAAEPHRLDPKTLETLGLDRLDGVLGEGDAFSAHPHIDPASQFDDGKPCLVNFSAKAGLSTTITIYEFAVDGTLQRQHAHAIPGFAFLHDMAITPNYCIFFQNPVTLNPLPYLLGFRGAAECVKFDPNASTKIVVIPRDGSRDVRILETEPCFVFHHANAWEKDGDIFVDSICYESFPQVDPDADFRDVDFEAIPEGQLWQFRVNLAEERVNHEVIERRCCEFPVLHPQNVGRENRYLYMGIAHPERGNAPLQGVMKIDRETGTRQVWSFAPRGFSGEPAFVPRPNATAEDDGWLLSLIYDAEHHRSKLAIFETRSIEAGPIAQLHLKYHIPYGLHGGFTETYFGD
ncbi:MAG: carotenoid oxygenase family protein [Cyanobacteria bacterium SID2]|nr:carotenoid oxygenase family protein [Cyanobacteria bacterium SID2]MBP0006463.1 carotenoid oxygenase family protein [Cyanobacteria bacterium SBC]